jgi:RNA polymerase sigma factor (sigma-70 family)
MPAEPTFSELIERARRGEEPATAELLRLYEPALRRVIQVRLFDARIRRLHDGDDICQSVLGSFFVRLALGQYEIDTPEALMRLLGVMARNKIADKARRCERERRALERVPLDELPETALAGPAETPSQALAVQDLIQEARRRLNPEERHLLDLRGQGLEWVDIAAQVGGQPDALRKRLARAASLVTQQLGLSEGDDE